ncbi:MAG TPA: biopolymer transporter ExbD [Ohtaekwangia sp.]|uniref:ExbD/TolR family protein n=1 Tax=Ohtaekwangia sp. TaxID=2066019 RepID=UPI002F9572F6
MAAIASAPAASSGKVRRKRTTLHIDMTPMVDLAFLLLTFFILTNQLIKEAYIMRVTVPEKAEASSRLPTVKADRVVTLILGEKDKIYWYHGIVNPQVHVTDFSAKGIRAMLLQKKTEINGLFLLIKPSEKSRYKNLVDILDEMEITKIQRFSLVEITPEDKVLVSDSNL